MNPSDADAPATAISDLSPTIGTPSNSNRGAQMNANQPLVEDSNLSDSAESFDRERSRFLDQIRYGVRSAMILGIVLAIPLAFLTYISNPMLYTAEATFLVQPNVSRLLPENADSSPIDLASYTIFKNTQKDHLLSPYSLNKALLGNSVLGADQADPIGWLTRRLKVTCHDQSEFVTVSITHQDPKIAHQLVNAVVDVYISDFIQKENSERFSRLECLERIHHEQEEKIRKKRSELSNLCQSLGIVSDQITEWSQKAILKQVTEVRAELSKTEFEIRRTQTELASQGCDEKEANQNSKESPECIQLRKKVGLLETQIEPLRKEYAALLNETKKYGKTSIDVDMLRLEVKNLEPRLQEIAQAIDRTKIEMQSASRITRMPSTGVPMIGSSNVRIWRAMIASLIGLLSSFVLMGCWCLFFGSANTPDRQSMESGGD